MLLEFVADLYPESNLLPKDPVLRAKARFFIDAVSTKVVPAWHTFFSGNGPADNFLNGLDQIQALLPASGFAVGQYSIADAAVAPFIARAYVSLSNEVGGFPEGDGKKTLEAINSSRFARFQKYWQDIQARPNFKATFDEVGHPRT